MAYKKRTKVSANFSMSSMTDIIFLLLIFFMLTSSVVAPNALNLKLPGKQYASKEINKKPTALMITKSGAYTINGRSISIESLDAEVKSRSAADPDLSVTIAMENDTPVEFVVAVMDIALRYSVDAILLTEVENE
jgi:biopolymer transport protein ExbD